MDLCLKHVMPPQAVAIHVENGGGWCYDTGTWIAGYGFSYYPVAADRTELQFIDPETGEPAESADMFDLNEELGDSLPDDTTVDGKRYRRYRNAMKMAPFIDPVDKYGEMDEDEVYEDAYAGPEGPTSEVIKTRNVIKRFDINRAGGEVENIVLGLPEPA